MEFFNTIAAGAGAGSMVGGYIATLTGHIPLTGSAIGGLVGAGCGLAVGVCKVLRDAPGQLALA